MRMASVDAPEFWEERYAQGEDGWETGRAHPSLVHWIDTTPPPPGRIAVPGCGRGHDVRFLAGRGYDVVGFDFAPVAIAEARALATREGVTTRFEQDDVFTLPTRYPHAFDGVWEYTCFCAIDPRRRAEYVDVLAAILRPGGWLLAVFFPMRSYGAGPPYPVARDEVRRLLVPHFRVERELAPPVPVPRRLGQEWMLFARRV
jgi:SAM-dependent methyltransferase